MTERYDYYDSAVYDLSITGYIESDSLIGWVLFSPEEDRYLAVMHNDVYDQQETETFDDAFAWVVDQYENNTGS